MLKHHDIFATHGGKASLHQAHLCMYMAPGLAYIFIQQGYVQHAINRDAVELSTNVTFANKLVSFWQNTPCNTMPEDHTSAEIKVMRKNISHYR